MAELQTWRELAVDLTLRERFILSASAAGVLSVLVLLVMFLIPPSGPILESRLSGYPADPPSSVEQAPTPALALNEDTTAPGFEILDAPSWAQSAGDQRLRYQRELEAGIARSIQSFDGVASARVHLVLPRESLFAENAKAGKASVLLRPRSDALSAETKDSISLLVAGAVEGIEPGAVAIVTTGGSAPSLTSSASPAQPAPAGPGVDAGDEAKGGVTENSVNSVNAALIWFREHPDAARTLALAALFVLIYFALLRPVRLQVKEILRRVASENEDIGGSSANASNSALPLGSEAGRFGGSRRTVTDRRLSEAVAADPRKAARLVESWLGKSHEAEASS